MTGGEPTLVLMPAFNEERSVGDVVRAVGALGFDACVVDDGSTDRTALEARRAGAQVLSLPLNVGVGGALRCGFRYALRNGYQRVVQVDADGQHDPREIPALIETMQQSGADLVVGSRFAPGAPPYAVDSPRRFAMRVLAWRAGRATRTTITDSTSGFRVVRRPLLDQFAADYPVEYLGDTVEALIEAGTRGAKVVERPIPMSIRRHGSGSAGPFASLWYLVRVLIAVDLMHRRRERPPLALPDDHGVLP